MVIRFLIKDLRLFEKRPMNRVYTLGLRTRPVPTNVSHIVHDRTHDA